MIKVILIALAPFISTIQQGQSADRAWWPILAFLGSLFVLPIVLILGGLIRNFILFRK